MNKTECGICGGEAFLVSEEREVRVGKRSAVVEDRFFRCSACEEELYEPGQMDAVMLRASTVIREDLGLLMPEEIRALRESLELSQADFERLLRAGPKTVVRWERGTVFQNQATDALLRTLRDVTGVAEFLSARTGIPVPMPTWYAAFSAFDSVVSNPMQLRSELLRFDPNADELLEKDQFVTGPEEQTYTVRTGGLRKAAA